jgi:putative peptide zinc metalloprotease protein
VPWWKQIVHHYLFFKVPLARPDAFLRRTLPVVEPLFSRTALVAFVLLGLVGLHLLSRQWETFVGTFADLNSTAGVALFTAILAVVKALHELGHGYTAVRCGSRVSTMGVAFMVMFPVLYTDSTDAWRLASRRARVAIDAAGIAVELMVAVLATWAWVLLDDGLARYVAFALATSGWLMSLVVNLNPLMRFDGYYLFADAINVPNLQERSFAMGRWWLRKSLWGWRGEKPEAASTRRTAFFVAFAFATWLYRLVLFLGIAVLVYHFFFKALGVVMFAIEIGWFIVLPIARELRAWHRERGRFGARARWTAGVLVTALAACFVPWSGTVHVPAIVTADAQVPVYAPRPARIVSIAVREGDEVQAGQLMLRLEDPEIASALERAREREAALRERLARAGADERDRAERLVLRREHQLERERIAAHERERERLDVRAPIAGRVVQLARELHAGRWVDAKTNLAWVAQPQQRVARGYVRADDAQRLVAHAVGRFRDEAISGVQAPVRVELVAAAASRTMDLWQLASPFGGPIAAREARQPAQSEVALVEVKARLQPSEADVRWPHAEVRGEMLLPAKPITLAERVLRRVVQRWNQERSA